MSLLSEFVKPVVKMICDLEKLQKQRAKEAAPRVAAGELPHLKQMAGMDLARQVRNHAEFLIACAEDGHESDPEQIRVQGADLCTYTAALVAKLTETEGEE